MYFKKRHQYFVIFFTSGQPTPCSPLPHVAWAAHQCDKPSPAAALLMLSAFSSDDVVRCRSPSLIYYYGCSPQHSTALYIWAGRLKSGEPKALFMYCGIHFRVIQYKEEFPGTISPFNISDDTADALKIDRRFQQEFLNFIAIIFLKMMLRICGRESVCCLLAADAAARLDGH